MDRLYIPVIILHLSIVAKTFYCNDQLRSLELLTAKTPLLHMSYCMNWLTHDFGLEQFDRSHGAGTSSPSHWQQVEEQAPNLWVGWCVSSWWPLFPSRSSVLIHIYIYIFVCVCALLYEFCFLWFTSCVLLSDNSLIPGCLWLLVFVLKNTLILGIWCSTIPHLPGCFFPWTVFQNIGFNMVPSDPFMSYLATVFFKTRGHLLVWAPPRLASSGLAWPCLAMPCHALSCLAWVWMWRFFVKYKKWDSYGGVILMRFFYFIYNLINHGW